ncbi:MAG: hypothetical protein ACRDQW_14230 [Haloechinothrix sp.]
MAHGDLVGAEKSLSRIESNVQSSTRTPLPQPMVTAAHGRVEPKGTLRDLVTGKYLRRTVVVPPTSASTSTPLSCTRPGCGHWAPAWAEH